MTDEGWIERIARGLEVPGAPTSDFDLNTDAPGTVPTSYRDAAVLVALTRRDGTDRVILTKRSSALKHHPGQIAFPGGKREEADADAMATALREAHEEIGLDPALVDPLGTAEAHDTVTGFRVSPVIGIVTRDYTPRLDRSEVAEAFEVPLAHVLDPANFQVQSRYWRKHRRYYYVVPWGPYYIWGATARILRALADRVAAT